MIAVSVKDGEDIVDLLLRKDADVNAKSEFPIIRRGLKVLTVHR